MGLSVCGLVCFVSPVFFKGWRLLGGGRGRCGSDCLTGCAAREVCNGADGGVYFSAAGGDGHLLFGHWVVVRFNRTSTGTRPPQQVAPMQVPPWLNSQAAQMARNASFSEDVRRRAVKAAVLEGAIFVPFRPPIGDQLFRETSWDMPMKIGRSSTACFAFPPRRNHRRPPGQHQRASTMWPR